MTPPNETDSDSAEQARVRRWSVERPTHPLVEYGLVVVVVAFISVAGWFIPASHYPLGFVYLLAVVGLSIRIGTGAVWFAAALSAVAWNFVFMPPRLAFSAIRLEASIMLATYFLVALFAGQLTARLRAQEKTERVRERRTKRLLELSRALESAGSELDAADAALERAADAFRADPALYLFDAEGTLHAARQNTFALEPASLRSLEQSRAAGFTGTRLAAAGADVALEAVVSDSVLGILALRPRRDTRTTLERELMRSFAAEIAAAIERRRLRAAREREKLLTESDRLHRTLLDSVSHELKTPLAILRAAVEQVAATEDAGRRTRLVAEIQTATRRLDRLVANLLNQTRLEAGAIKPRLDWCDVRDIISVARRELADSLAGHPLTLQIDEDTPLLFADAGLMEAVVENLLLNAAAHTPPGTAVHLRAALDPATRRVFLRIEDRGPGLPADMQRTLFEKFHRGKSAPSGGLGLGLSIVHGFMLAQGGGVEAENSPGGGAVFTVYLPHVEPGSLPPE